MLQYKGSYCLFVFFLTFFSNCVPSIPPSSSTYTVSQLHFSFGDFIRHASAVFYLHIHIHTCHATGPELSKHTLKSITLSFISNSRLHCIVFVISGLYNSWPPFFPGTG